jgi:hypothetical protein
MPKKSDEAENRIQEALQAYHDRGKPKISSVAREFGVDYQRLLRRVHGRPSRSGRQGVNNCLDKSQEQALISWIELLHRANAPPSAEEIGGTANEILERGGSDRRVGKNWPYRFLKRLPIDYSYNTQKIMEAERVDAERLPTIHEWYNQLDLLLQAYKIGPKNIYNFDETGFQLGQGKPQKVVTKHGKSAKPMPTGGIGETVTAVECIAADGWLMPPMILFAGTVHLESWFRDQPKLPDDYIIAMSSSGWNNEVRAYKSNLLIN